MARKLDPKSKAGFVRSQLAAMSAADVVAKAKSAGIVLDPQYVYAIRGAKKKRARSGNGKLGPASAETGRSGAIDHGNALVAEIERIVEARVGELLKAKLGALFR